MPKALVTGGTGFVGVHLCRSLLARGYQVVALDVNDPDGHFPAAADFNRGDVCRLPDVERAARGCDVVIANAALVPLTQVSPQEFLRVNSGGTRNTMEAAWRRGCYAAYVSSSAIFGIPRANPLPSDARMAPFEPYGRSKAAAEMVVREFRQRGMRVASLRPRTLVGDGRLGLFEVIFNRVRAGKSVPLFGQGNNRVQLCDVTDYANAVIAAVESEATGDFNIGADRFGTVREDIDDLILAAGSPSSVIPIPVWLLKAILIPATALKLSPFGPWHWNHASRDFYFETSTAERALNWAPERSNAEALIAAYRCFDPDEGDAGGSAHRQPVSRLVGRLLRI